MVSLSYFRDVVVVTESEYDLQKDLCTVRKRLSNFYLSPKMWVGITGTVITDFILPALVLYFCYQSRILSFCLQSCGIHIISWICHCTVYGVHYFKHHIIGYPYNNTTQYIREESLYITGQEDHLILPHECRDLSNCPLLNKVTFHVFNYLGKKFAQIQVGGITQHV